MIKNSDFKTDGLQNSNSNLKNQSADLNKTLTKVQVVPPKTSPSISDNKIMHSEPNDDKIVASNPKTNTENHKNGTNPPSISKPTNSARVLPKIQEDLNNTKPSPLPRPNIAMAMPKLTHYPPAQFRKVSPQFSLKNLSQPLVVSNLKASEFDRGFSPNECSTFPSLSSNSSSTMPNLKKEVPVRNPMELPVMKNSRPYSYSYRTFYYPPIYRPAVPHLKQTNLGFYTPVKSHRFPQVYNPFVMRYPVRNRFLPYSYNQNTLNYMQKNRSASVQKRVIPKPKKAVVPRSKKTARVQRKRKAAKPRKEVKAGGEISDLDDDFNPSRFRVRQVFEPVIDMPIKIIMDKKEKPLTHQKLIELEKKYFEKKCHLNYKKNYGSGATVKETKEGIGVTEESLVPNNIKSEAGGAIEASNTSKNKRTKFDFGVIEDEDKRKHIPDFGERKMPNSPPCDVCGEFNSPDVDLIVRCEGCGVAVHKLCYGIKRTPDRHWFCQPCSVFKPKAKVLPTIAKNNKPGEETAKNAVVGKVAKEGLNKQRKPEKKPVVNTEKNPLVKTGHTEIKNEFVDNNNSEILALQNEKRKHKLGCVFCPIVSEYPRAFKQTLEGEWAHLGCAVYYSEMFFKKPEIFEGFSVSSLDKRRSLLKCQLCKSKFGYCLQCNAKSCSKSYHPFCARISDLPLYLASVDNNKLEPRLWCKDHASNSKRTSNLKKKPKEWRPPAVSTRKSANSDWQFTECLHFYPQNEGYKHEECNELFEQIPEKEGDRNVWKVTSTTDIRSQSAFEAHKLIATQWDKTIVGGLEPVIERRMSKKAMGYSSLSNPAGEVLAAANWSFWEINSEVVSLCIKFMVCRRFTSKHISTRRKRCGSLLAAHLVDLALSRRKVQWVLVCSESGYPERFWKSLGFTTIPKKERAGFSVVSEAELNPFRDTVLMRLTRREVFMSAGYSLTAKAFPGWSEKNRREELRVKFLEKGAVLRSEKLSLF